MLNIHEHTSSISLANSAVDTAENESRKDLETETIYLFSVTIVDFFSLIFRSSSTVISTSGTVGDTAELCVKRCRACLIFSEVTNPVVAIRKCGS